MEKFKVFIAFRNLVCCNMCVSTDIFKIATFWTGLIMPTLLANGQNKALYGDTEHSWFVQ